MKQIKLALSATALVVGGIGSAFTTSHHKATTTQLYFYHANSSGQLTSFIGNVTTATAESDVSCNGTGAVICGYGYATPILGFTPGEVAPSGASVTFKTSRS